MSDGEPAWPLSATIAGVAVVTIPLNHYAELLESRRVVAENSYRRRADWGAASRVGRDPEVAAFLADNIAGRTIPQLYASCVARFGAARAPSRSSIQRFRHSLRSEA